MTFEIVTMICVAGMSPADCCPEPGYSRDVAVIGEVSNELSAVSRRSNPLVASAVPEPRLW